MGFEKVGGGSGSTWNPKVNADGSHKMTGGGPEDTLVGYYAERRDGVGQHLSSVITVVTDEGVNWDVWLDTVLEDRIGKVRMGSYIQIEYKGKALKKYALQKLPAALRDTDYYNQWEVGVDKDVPPMEVVNYTAANTPAAAPAATGQAPAPTPPASPRPTPPAAPPAGPRPTPPLPPKPGQVNAPAPTAAVPPAAAPAAQPNRALPTTPGKIKELPF